MEEEGSHGRSWTFLTRGFLLTRVVCGAGNDELPDKLETGRRRGKKPARCDPKCGQRDGAACSLMEDDRLSMVMGAGALENGRLSMALETGASSDDASTSRLRVSGAGEAQPPVQRVVDARTCACT